MENCVEELIKSFMKKQLLGVKPKKKRVDKIQFEGSVIIAMVNLRQ